MTKTKWWLLKCLFGISTFVAIAPLTWPRYLIAVSCILLFAVFYAQRLIAQLGLKPEQDRTIYTVPLHVGQNIEVPKGSKVTYY